MNIFELFHDFIVGQIIKVYDTTIYVWVMFLRAKWSPYNCILLVLRFIRVEVFCHSGIRPFVKLAAQQEEFAHLVTHRKMPSTAAPGGAINPANPIRILMVRFFCGCDLVGHRFPNSDWLTQTGFV